MTHADPRHPGVSVREAAIHFGTSESDIRRRIKRGELRAESLARPGGTLLRVLLDTRQVTPGVAETVEPPRSTDPAPEAVSDAPALTLSLLAMVEADRETISSQAETIAALSERVGRAEAEAALLRAEVERLRRPWWRRLW